MACLAGSSLGADFRIRSSPIFPRAVTLIVAVAISTLAFFTADPLRSFLFWISIPVLFIGIQVAIALSWRGLPRKQDHR